MIARGFDVEPTDGVAEIARKAEERLGRSVRVLRFDQLDAIEAYDAIWANASLLHVPRSALADVVTSIWRALRPNGWHSASFKGGGREGRDSCGRYFNYLIPDELRSAYAAGGAWKVFELSEYEGGGYESGLRPWVAVSVRK